MVKDLADLSAVELEVRVREVAEGDSTHEEQQPGVVSLALGLEGIVTELVTVGLVVDVVLLLPGVPVRVRREDVLVTSREGECLGGLTG